MLSKRNAKYLGALTSLLFLSAAAQQPAPPAHAPSPGSAALYIDHQQIAAAMTASLDAKSNPALGPIASTDQYFINEVRRTGPAPPAVHPGWTELHYIIEGSGTFVTGGTIRTAADGSTKVIDSGVSRKVQKGDAVLVPAGTPHWYQQIDGSLTAIEVRFIAPGEATVK
jgi:mannose-6-phosphate isomerase-like protein (cupin superfamily)